MPRRLTGIIVAFAQEIQMKNIMDPSFKYRPSFDTNIKQTFERLREAQKALRLADFSPLKRAAFFTQAAAA
jgi:hypothetical protein